MLSIRNIPISSHSLTEFGEIHLYLKKIGFSAWSLLDFFVEYGNCLKLAVHFQFTNQVNFLSLSIFITFGWCLLLGVWGEGGSGLICIINVLNKAIRPPHKLLSLQGHDAPACLSSCWLGPAPRGGVLMWLGPHPQLTQVPAELPVVA